jgi:class 3 adenylate cyclase
MSIRLKIILVVLPLFIVTVLVVGLTSAFSARAGLTRLAVEALGFKAQELQNYAENQWDLLVENDLALDQDYVAVTRRAVQSYARGLIRSDSELIFAVNESGEVEMTSDPERLPSGETVPELAARAGDYTQGWQQLTAAGDLRVAQAFTFAPFGWFVLVSETEASFYAEVDEINRNMFTILGISLAAAIILLWLFAQALTGSITRLISTMLYITQTNELSERVEIEYRDEIGSMATTFNKMLAKLEVASDQIRATALRAVVAERQQRRIRSVFEKYVPVDVLDSVLEAPDRALEGQQFVLPVLFSDIRSFTTISEQYLPDELVTILNRYFEPLVDIIRSHGGVVDKYIGDAIMAFFGAPERKPDDAYRSVKAAVLMQERIREFNARLESDGKVPFKTGIGIHYGNVIVGNIGSDIKMDYTIIGDSVNYGSRLEGLTKPYQQEIILSKSVFRKVGSLMPCRFVDLVQVKGRTQGEAIYTVKQSLTETEKAAWKFYHAGIKQFFARSFKPARELFVRSLEYLPADFLCGMYVQRCDDYLKNPPPADWTGIDIKTSK